ncbi:Wall-associated receptor kinase 2 [Vitis vinifera]|uniref:Wall-associated receptor kinase 2 n=1 Tax=Vitis vinifera TaxID=29760 RepID=A0A438IG66_VITVI|nr:Wall-associated receptor kinase 2 [Vitis vinifera]
MMVRLMLVGLLLLASAAAAAATVGQAKEGCLDKCGDVSIPYPFGKPSPEGNNVQVLDISLEGELLILNYVSHDCYNRSGGLDSLYSYGSHLTPGQFNISSTRNKFTMVGCDTYAWFRGQRGEESYRTGCMSLCDNITAVRNGSCSGNGCCQTSIPDELSDIRLTLGTFNNYSEIWEFNPCGYAFIVEESHFTFSSDDLKDLKGIEKLPMVFDWAFGKETCQVEDENSQTNYACKGNSSCNKRKTGWGYLCNCSEGYQGNPYLESGCQDINECENSILNKCENPETCVNTQGNYTCSCPMWYQGDGKIDGQRCIPNRLQMIHAAMGIGIALLVLLVSSTWLFWALKKRRFIKLKKKYFQQNGGSELRQLSRQGSTARIKIFTFEELEKATKKYDESNIIGRGGFGTVYKGTLTDGRIVAIKKSKMVEPKPRDVKSTNILLDAEYNVKVCDFGASRLVPLDQTQLSTAVQGTPGYLDPESMQTNQVTEKSDVYSFGVVLVELLTGKKALFFDRPKEQRILTIEQWKPYADLKVAQLAKRCLSIKGEDRPTMKEVVLELEIVRMIGENAEQNPEDNAYLLRKSSAHCYLGGAELSTATHSMVGNFLLPVSDAR